MDCVLNCIHFLLFIFIDFTQYEYLNDSTSRSGQRSANTTCGRPPVCCATVNPEVGLSFTLESQGGDFHIAWPVIRPAARDTGYLRWSSSSVPPERICNGAGLAVFKSSLI